MRAISLYLLAIHLCTGPAAAVTFIAGWVAIALYALLLGLSQVLSWLGACSTSLCEIAAIHVLVLGIVSTILAVLNIFLVPCFWQPVWWILAGLSAIWGPIAGGCKLRE